MRKNQNSSKSVNHLHHIADKTILSDVSLKLRFEMAEMKKLSVNLGLEENKGNMFHRMSIKGRNMDRDIEVALTHLHKKKFLQLEGKDLPFEYQTRPNVKVRESAEIKQFRDVKRSRLEDMIPNLSVEYSAIPQIREKKDNIFDISELSSLPSFDEPLTTKNEVPNSRQGRKESQILHDINKSNAIFNEFGVSPKKHLNVVELFHIEDSPMMKRKDSNEMLAMNSAFARNSKLFKVSQGGHRRQAIDVKRVFSKKVSLDGNRDFVYDKVGWSVDPKSSDNNLIRIKTLNKRNQYGRIKASPKKQSILHPFSLDHSVSEFILNSASGDEFSNVELLEHKRDDDYKVYLDDKGGVTLIKNYLLTPRKRNESISFDNSAIRRSPVVTNMGRVNLTKLVDEEGQSYEQSYLKCRQDKPSMRSSVPGFRLDSRQHLSNVGNQVINNSRSLLETRLNQQTNLHEMKLIKEKNVDVVNKFKSQRIDRFVSEVTENRSKMNSIDTEIKRLIFNASQVYDKIDKKIQKNIKELY